MSESAAHPRAPSFIPLSDDGGWTSVNSKKKAKPKAKANQTVTFADTQPAAQRTQVPRVASIVPRQTFNTNSKRLEEADGPIKLKTLSMEMRQEITNRRVAKLWTQADLNKYCSFPQNTIREIESGRQPPNQHQLTVLNRILKGGIHYSE